MVRIDGDRVRALRQERAYSLRELAARSNVGVATIARIEQGGTYQAWPRTVRLLAEALGVMPTDLFASDRAAADTDATREGE